MEENDKELPGKTLGRKPQMSHDNKQGFLWSGSRLTHQSHLL